MRKEGVLNMRRNYQKISQTEITTLNQLAGHCIYNLSSKVLTIVQLAILDVELLSTQQTPHSVSSLPFLNQSFN